MTLVTRTNFPPPHVWSNFRTADLIARRVEGEVRSTSDISSLLGQRVRVFKVDKDGSEVGKPSDGTVTRINSELSSVVAKSRSVPSISVDNGKEGSEHSVRTFHVGKDRYLVVYRTPEGPSSKIL